MEPSFKYTYSSEVSSTIIPETSVASRAVSKIVINSIRKEPKRQLQVEEKGCTLSMQVYAPILGPRPYSHDSPGSGTRSSLSLLTRSLLSRKRFIKCN